MTPEQAERLARDLQHSDPTTTMVSTELLAPLLAELDRRGAAIDQVREFVQQAEPEPEPEPEPRRKFTMLVGPGDDERARRVVDDVVLLAGIRPTKSMRADVVRALFAIADQDAKLRAAVAARLSG